MIDLLSFLAALLSVLVFAVVWDRTESEWQEFRPFIEPDWCDARMLDTTELWLTSIKAKEEVLN